MFSADEDIAGKTGFVCERSESTDAGTASLIESSYHEQHDFQRSTMSTLQKINSSEMINLGRVDELLNPIYKL
ncbi:MAG TPA: hypothetical protein DGU45_05615 [Planctomycetes bacterium]|nr:hypothetical protein [Planctomycetota bacterium]